MGGSAQFRKKIQEKSKPQTAFEQVRARFGEDVTWHIEGVNQEGFAKGMIAMVDKFGDDVVPLNDISNGYLPIPAEGRTNLFGGQITVSGNNCNRYVNGNYSISGADGETTAAIVIAHELTHKIAGFTATFTIRKIAEMEDLILNEYNYSRFQYGHDLGLECEKPGGLTKDRLEHFLISERGMPFMDAHNLSVLTFSRYRNYEKFCSDVTAQASRTAGVAQSDLFSAISKYASDKGATEAIPEAVADVTIHGDKASWASKAVYNAFNELLN